MSQRRKVKEILRYSPQGELLNFGFLVTGYIEGIKVIATREVLLLLGARLSQDRVSEHFYYTDSLVVLCKGHEYRIFADNRRELNKLGNGLYYRRHYPVRKQKTFGEQRLLTWGLDEIPEDNAAVNKPVSDYGYKLGKLDKEQVSLYQRILGALFKPFKRGVSKHGNA